MFIVACLGEGCGEGVRRKGNTLVVCLSIFKFDLSIDVTFSYIFYWNPLFYTRPRPILASS